MGNIYLQTISGQRMHCAGTGRVRIRVPGLTEVEVDVLVVEEKPLGFEFILGMNAVIALGGVEIISTDRVRFGPNKVTEEASSAVGAVVNAEEVVSSTVGAVMSADEVSSSVGAEVRDEASCGSLQQENPAVPAGGEDNARKMKSMLSSSSEQIVIKSESIRIDEKDYTVVFEPKNRTWTVEWKWAGGQAPEGMKNKVAAYTVPEDRRSEYEAELEKWIDEGWLVPYDETEHGRPEGLIPLMRCCRSERRR